MYEIKKNCFVLYNRRHDLDLSIPYPIVIVFFTALNEFIISSGLCDNVAYEKILNNIFEKSLN